jgi:predicted protein tyrosine phosphatase
MDISSAECFRPKDDYCISILSPGRRVDLKMWRKSRVLSLRFDDVEGSLRLDDKEKDRQIRPHDSISLNNAKLFNTNMANKVIKFVENIEKSRRKHNLIIHCEAGRSRSAAIAKYVSKRFNFPFPSDYDYYNLLVYNTLTNILTDRKA